MVAWGEYINLVAGVKLLPEKTIYRGGSIDYVKGDADICFPKSIINLRNRVDFDGFDADYYHFPMANKVEKYDTTQKEVRKWLNQIIAIFQEETTAFPVLIHCLSGKDRTGIVVASLLLILEIEREVIIEEYLLSDGEVSRALISQAIDGIGDPVIYFKGIDFNQIRDNVRRSGALLDI